jgi:hypothetical protein
MGLEAARLRRPAAEDEDMVAEEDWQHTAAEP